VKGGLPGPLRLLSNNFGNLIENVPEIGKNGSSMSALNHAGSIVEAVAGVILFPKTKSAIIVLTNTLGLAGTADYSISIVDGDLIRPA
jgi:hypothetical protein